MKFKLDENLPESAGEALHAAGHDVSSVSIQKLNGSPDTGIHQVCAREDRALVTLDLDFSNPLRFPTEKTAGIIILRPRRATLSAIQELSKLLPSLVGREPPSGRLWIVEPGRLRVFRGGA